MKISDLLDGSSMVNGISGPVGYLKDSVKLQIPEHLCGFFFPLLGMYATKACKILASFCS